MDTCILVRTSHWIIAGYAFLDKHFLFGLDCFKTVGNKIKRVTPKPNCWKSEVKIVEYVVNFWYSRLINKNYFFRILLPGIPRQVRQGDRDIHIWKIRKYKTGAPYPICSSRIPNTQQPVNTFFYDHSVYYFEHPFVFTNVKIPSYVYVTIAYFNIALFRLFIGLSIVEVLIINYCYS